MNPNFKDKCGNTLLHIAANFGYIDIMKVLLPLVGNLDTQNKYQNTPLPFANSEIMVSNNVDPNIPNEYRITPCDYAVNNGLYPITKILETYIIK